MTSLRLGQDVYAERGGTEPATPQEMLRVGLPILVVCAGCDLTMVGLNAFFDDDSGLCWCEDCSGASAATSESQERAS